jgi:hypothetical protein
MFGIALLHPRATLFQNSKVNQLCFRVFVVFDKISVHPSSKWIFEGEKTLLSLV